LRHGTNSPPPHAGAALERVDATSLAGARALYRLQAPIYDLTRWVFLRGRSTAVQRLGVTAGQSALEIGCGTGSNLLRLRRLTGAMGEVHGIDLSSHMLARARAKIRRGGWQNVHVHERDAGEFDFGREFDAILYSYSLSMIPQWRRSLESAARHLAPGGRLVVVDFTALENLGMLRRPLLAWLRAHHVEPERRTVESLTAIFGAGAVETECGRGRWHFVARCTRGGR
jgi:S-adenosylmethionine-diacylgycerolhomoserine-N-methlytransferase